MEMQLRHPHDHSGELAIAVPEHLPAASITPALSLQLTRMFRDPRVLETDERLSLIADLRQLLAVQPNVPEVRVLLGMALAVNLEAQEALEELRIAARQAPACFIARLKYGELLMRLRIADKAAEETHQAARLAVNAQQSELARLQAEKIRTMRREGVERGGYAGLLPRLFGRRHARGENTASAALAATK